MTVDLWAASGSALTPETKEENMTYFGFALADGMFAGDCEISRKSISPDTVREMQGSLIPCLNPSHVATIVAMRDKFGIDVPIPETPPKVILKTGDSVIVMGVRGLARLTDRHEYTQEEVNGATFTFSCYTVK